MSMSHDGGDREHSKFVEDPSGNTAVRVLLTGGKITRQRQNFSGAAGTGSDGDANRVFTLSTSSDVEVMEVFLDGVLLVDVSQYSVDNTAKTVTFIGNVFNSQNVVVFYNV